MCLGNPGQTKEGGDAQQNDEEEPPALEEADNGEKPPALEEEPPALEKAEEKDDNAIKRTLSEEIQQECICCSPERGGGINRGLLPSKLFYFFFFAGNGALIPYLVLFFKQLGLNPSQVGIVSGLKPFISFLFSPIWGYVADKTRRTRIIYVISFLAYVGGFFAYSLAPSNDLCKARGNSSSTKGSSHHPFIFHMHTKRSVLFDDKSNSNYKLYIQKATTTANRKRQRINGKPATKTRSTTAKDASMFSYKAQLPYLYTDVTTTLMGDPLFHMPSSVAFFGMNDEFLPTVDFNNNNDDAEEENEATKGNIDDNNDIAMSSAKTWHGAVHHSHAPWTICGAAKANSVDSLNLDQTEGQRNTIPIKKTFFYLLIVTVTATLFSCPLITFVDTATIRKLRETDNTHKYGNQRMWGSFGWGVVAFTVGAIISTLPLCPGINNEVNYIPAFYIFAVFLVLALISGWKLKFEDDTIEISQESEDGNAAVVNLPSRSQRIMDGLKLLKSPVYLSFIVTTFFIGVTMSIIKTFLFWYLKDIGAPQILFSIIAAVNCISEVTVYFFASSLIKKLSHFGVLYVALICYSLRLFYYGLLTNPWFVLAAEPLSGITTAAAWAAMTSYVGMNASPESVTTLQGKSTN